MKRLMVAAGVVMAAAMAVSTNAAAEEKKIDASTRYVPEQNAEKAAQIAARMWTVMKASPCWYMNRSTNNYSFSGVNNYRYAGYETTAGQIKLVSTGSFGGYDMAQVVIGGTQYWIGLADSRTMAMSSVFGNSLITNWYTAAAPGQVCV